MNTASHTAAAPAERPAGLFDMVDGVRQWLAYRDTVDALSKLSPRELADIGVEASVADYADEMTKTRAR